MILQKSSKFFVATFVIYSLLFNALTSVKACGPDYIKSVFAFQNRPDDSLNDFANGKLGILRPDFARSYLVVSYKILNGYKFTENERQQIVKLWNDRLDINNSPTDEEEPDNTPVLPEDETKTALEKWLETRKRVENFSESTLNINDIWQSQENKYFYYQNCNKSSFQTATETLEKRISKYGANNSSVLEWLKGQDIVFSNCSSYKGLPTILDSNHPIWLQKDRDYQIASSLFYSAKFDEALENFTKIANDENSDWKNVASYMIARIYLRKASLENELNEDFLQKAESQLFSILQNPNQKEVHRIAKQMLVILAYRSKYENQLKKFSDIIAQNTESVDIYNELDNYTSYLDFNGFNPQQPQIIQPKVITTEPEPTFWQKIWNFFFGSNIVKAQTESNNIEVEQDEYEMNKFYQHLLRNYLRFDYREIKSDEISEEVRKSDISDWIFTFQANDKESLKHSWDKWKETTKLHWLLAVVSKAETDFEHLDEIRQEVGKIPTKSPAFFTANYHIIRLLIEQNKFDEARHNLDKILKNKGLNFPISTKNDFYKERMFASQNLDEFLLFSQRLPVAFTDYEFVDRTESIKKGEYEWERNILPFRYKSMLDEDSVEIFNTQMPLIKLIQAGKNQNLPDYLRKHILISAWVRAVLLDKKDLQIEIAQTLKQIAPEMKNDFENFLNSESELTAYFILLKFPVMRPYLESGLGRLTIPDSSLSIRGENWWELDTLKNEEKIVKESISVPFLTENDVNEAKIERGKIVSLGGASNILAEKVINFAKKYPNAEQIPEMLHCAVKATRYGDAGEDYDKNHQFSKTAFTILHNNYQNSIWTKKTPYWF